MLLFSLQHSLFVLSPLHPADLTDFADALDSILQQAEAPRSLSLEQLDELGQVGALLSLQLLACFQGCVSWGANFAPHFDALRVMLLSQAQRTCTTPQACPVP